jgi:hypothetical protein
MARFTAAPGLNELVARMVADRVKDIAQEVEVEAKTLAPPTKSWRSQRDPAVRPTHDQHGGVDGQEVPANLRFDLKSMDWDIEHRGVGPRTYMLTPKDESSGAVANLENCRCTFDLDYEGISREIKTGELVQEGARVSVKVACEAHLAVAAERGEVYPMGNVSNGTFFMQGAASTVRARLAAG